MDMLKNAADAVGDAVASVGNSAMFKIAESEINKVTDMDIEVEAGNIPSGEWTEWMAKTGVNSLCNSGTWAFLDSSTYNQRKIDLWKERGLKKIIMTVDENPEEEDQWIACLPEWEEGSTTLTLKWFPRALRWYSNNAWLESGPKYWWNLSDEIVFGLQLYQLPGKCFYKSDWLDNFEDVDAESPLPFGTKKYKRWFQFRHWIIFWYENSQWGYNWAWTTKPPALSDGTDFSLDAVLKLPSLPDLSLPSITLPSLPDIEMPSLPDAPSLPDMPDAPSLSAPSLSAPSIDLSNPSMPSMPDKKQRPKGKWSAHGYIELTDMKCIAKGSTLVLSNCKVTNFWKQGDGWGVDLEEEENKRFELETTSDEQAASWVESLVGSGVEEGEVGGCCTIA